MLIADIAPFYTSPFNRATNGDTPTTLNTTSSPLMISLVISQDDYDNVPATTLTLQGPRQGHSAKGPQVS